MLSKLRQRLEHTVAELRNQASLQSSLLWRCWRVFFNAWS
jgi:hypothetical protein